MKTLTGAVVILIAVAALLFATDALVIEPNGVITVNVQGRARSLDSALTPVGTIIAYGGAVDPPDGGWLLCDGRSLSSAEYPQLFAVIGTSFGNGTTAGDGTPATGDFNLPDMRGRFARGVDAGTGIDPDVADRETIQGAPQTGVGGIQEDAFQGHWHLRFEDGIVLDRAVVADGSDRWANTVEYGTLTGPYHRIFDRDSPSTDGTNGIPRTSSETRPANVAVNYIIKY